MAVGGCWVEGLVAGRAFREASDLESLGGRVADDDGIAVSTNGVSWVASSLAGGVAYRTISRPSLG